MMKAIFFIFMMSNLISMQVLAMECGINCTLQEAIKKQTPEMADHECCHGAKDQNEKENVPSCMDEISGACFHEFALNDLKLENNKLSDKTLFIIDLPVVDIIKIAGFHNRYRPKIPDQGYLNFKSGLNLYLIKDQFLI